MKNRLLIISLACILFGCSNDGDHLIGNWKNDADGSIINIQKSVLGYNIHSSSENGFINDCCKFLVIYSNSGFNCFSFPNKTARLTYQGATKFESEVITATDIKVDQSQSFHRISKF